MYESDLKFSSMEANRIVSHRLLSSQGIAAVSAFSRLITLVRDKIGLFRPDPFEPPKRLGNTPEKRDHAFGGRSKDLVVDPGCLP